jgi:uncharacterized protein (TIGR00106 family)
MEQGARSMELGVGWVERLFIWWVLRFWILDCGIWISPGKIPDQRNPDIHKQNRSLEVANMIAQLSVYPIGESTSLSRFVKKGVAVIEESGYTYEIGGMSTAVEVPDLDALFELVKKIHAAHVAEGARRVVIDMKVDDRRDKKATIVSKRTAVKKN